MDEIAPQIALLRQMYMGLDKKSRKAFLASIGHKEYLEYFATNKATSKGTKDIELQRQWFLSDNETRKRYMTWQQELDDLVYDERQRTKAAEKRANEAETRADEEKSRADMYEKILKEHGLL